MRWDYFDAVSGNRLIRDGDVLSYSQLSVSLDTRKLLELFAGTGVQSVVGLARPLASRLLSASFALAQRFPHISSSIARFAVAKFPSTDHTLRLGIHFVCLASAIKTRTTASRGRAPPPRGCTGGAQHPPGFYFESVG